jgi:pimeloyl-ACP methyl ester carboxylesterase
MLRGLARNMKHWLGFDRVAAERFKVITIDARGLGRTTAGMTFVDTIDDLADDVVRVLDLVKCEKAHILGVSLGGMVTMATGLRHPARTSSLTVINSSIAGSGVRRLTFPAIKVLLQAAVLGPAGYVGLARTLLGPGASEETCRKLARDWWAIDQKMNADAIIVAKQLLAAARFRVGSHLEKITAPTLVMYGTGDQFVPSENSRVIAGLIPGAKLVGIEGGGHELTHDRPDEVLKEISAFIASVEQPNSEEDGRKKRRASSDLQ